MANISTAISTARALAQKFPFARVACYHAQEFRILRYLKERRLDFLLNRKRGDGHILRDEEITRLLDEATESSVPFIVVATPVEEIGRDHDFDWGVIEPSSAHSIVQTAGRVNRHRLRPITEPNIAILQYNLRWINGIRGEPCFVKPGLESRSMAHRYSSPDLHVLLADADLDSLDARLRLGQGKMAVDEDRIVRARLKEPISALEASEDARSIWMTESYYRNYALRNGSKNDLWRAEHDNGGWVFRRKTGVSEVESWLTRNLATDEPRLSNDWLTFDLEQLSVICSELDIKPTAGLEFQVRCTNDQLALCWDRSFGFYV